MCLSALTDEQLMSRYVAGDHAALQELFERYAPQLKALLRRNGLRPEEAEDLVQQTFLQLHRARRDFKQGSPLRPWLLTIALNLKRRHLRGTARRERTLQADPVGEHGSHKTAERAEEALELRAALEELPEAQREVIELHWYQGLPFPEVAKIVGASVGAVKTRACRGYQRLRILLKGR